MKKSTLALIISLFLLIILLLVLRLFNHNRSAPINLSNTYFSPIQDQETTFSQPIFSGITPALPTTLPLLDLTPLPSADPTTRLDQYCQTIDNQSIPQIIYSCSWYDYDNNPQIDLFVNSDPSLTFLPITFSAAQLSANNLLDTIFPYQNWQLTNTRYLDVSEQSGSVPSSQANQIALTYNLTYQNIPIYHRQLNSPGQVIYSTIPYPVSQANLINFPYSYTPQAESHNLISPDQALLNITNGQAVLLDYWLEQDTPLTSNNPPNLAALTQLVFTQVSLEYRLDNDLAPTHAIPTYHFIGTGVDAADNLFHLSVLTPALNFTIQ